MAKTIVSHTITYFIMGALAAHFLNYAALMSNSNSGYRPLTSTIVIARTGVPRTIRIEAA